jgi:predicted nucleotidyltransferase
MTEPDRIIEEIVARLAARPGVRGVALVGSRASADPARADRFSDADFLVCCDDDERRRLLACDWFGPRAAPVLVFPRLMENECRVLFADLFACDIHFIGVETALRLSGPCELGARIVPAFAIRHDPDGLLRGLAERVQPTPPEPRDPATTSSVFWFDLAYCANLVARGDLFRASAFANRYLQLFLLDLLVPIDGPDDVKNVAGKIRRDQYDAIAATVSRLTPSEMREGLRRCMDCYWRLQRESAGEIDPRTLDVFRRIQKDVERLLDEPYGADGPRPVTGPPRSRRTDGRGTGSPATSDS